MSVSGIQPAAIYNKSSIPNPQTPPTTQINQLTQESGGDNSVNTDPVQSASSYVFDKSKITQELREAALGQLSSSSYWNIKLENWTSHFVVKQAYLRDQIIKNTDGEEQKQQLQRFDYESELYVDWIANVASNSITDIMNGDARVIFNEIESEREKFLQNFTPVFNKEGLKQQFVDMIHAEQELFSQSKPNDAEWDKILTSGGVGLEQLEKKLKTEMFNQQTEDSVSFDKLNYRDLVGTFNAFKMGSYGLSTIGSTELIFPRIGLDQAMVGLYLANTSMSSFVKNKITETLDRAMDNKIKIQNFQDAMWSLRLGSGGKEGFSFNQPLTDELRLKVERYMKSDDYKPSPSQFIQEQFAKLSTINSKLFVQNFLKLQQQVKASLLSGPEILGDVGKDKKVAFADSITRGYAETWNKFIDYLSIDESTKKDYYVPTRIGDTLDVKA
ncbi:hypothetical protein [Paenibacillus sp. NPDC058174]|uniref:hypothetical protein n=1 Tax=Paenibacillus sp. NPDC058174 TaxID=3346366 RepID=UPI0036D78AA2